MMTRRATILNVYSVLCRTLIVFVAACYGTIVATAESPVHGPFPYVLDADNTTVRLNQGNTRVPFEALQDGKVYRGIGLFNPMQVTAETSRRGKQSFLFETSIEADGRPHYEIDLVDTFTTVRGDQINIGDERYFAFSFRFDGQAFPIPTKLGFNIMQVRMGDCISPVRLVATTDGMIQYVGAGPSRNSSVLAPIEHDVWYDIVVGWRYDPFNPTGFHRVWFKRSNESEYAFFAAEETPVGCSSSWSPDEQVGTLQCVRVGMYVQPESVVHRMYYDEIRYSDRFSDVVLKED
ncbi:heparin lyase I family protein [Coraliomargarita akajimensis]|uniref:Uncharacterized protein n=1 Tax=Coraliomargarita akajimensis (strain DSM 45221 / IAM 15411 / JCM 23193 / KCTC 12865 / 04OKA010-24) TaxID=583355 RepID=D5EHK2_CORAD|nr:heparin lyase I family protein [Coraliomargarita akajimensis]ADE54043.1 hypothetical protein Caka_1021 [Coraliomargarita akajimensis DSM 45221]